MHRFALLVFIGLLLSCKPLTENTSPLEVEKVSIDSEEFKYANQISITFNQNIAISGQVPSASQIDAISISAGLKERCVWRFVNSRILSCELTQEPDFFTKYNISIDESFESRAGKLSSVFHSSFVTPLPSAMRLSAHNKNNYHEDESQYSFTFPSLFHLNSYQENRFSVGSIIDNIKLLSPSGKEVIITAFEYQNGQLGVRVSPANERFENGKYRFILPRGFQDKPTQKVLDKPFELASYTFNQDFVFYGLYCIPEQLFINTGRKEKLRPIEKVTTAPVSCAPERLVMGFSRETPGAVESLSGGKVSRSFHEEIQGIHYYGIYLDGKTQYKADFSTLKSRFGEKLALQEFTFFTQDASPFWRFDGQNNYFFVANNATVLGGDSSGKSLDEYIVNPSLLRRQIQDLEIHFSSIKSARALHAFLTRKQSQNRAFSPFKPSENTIQTTGLQTLPIHQWLDYGSGLLNLELKSVTPYQPSHSYLEDTNQKGYLKTLLGSAAFNLVVDINADLVVIAHDWQANYIQNAELSLVCPTMSSARLLGATNSKGVFHLAKEDWQSLIEPHNQFDCWIWASLGEHNAALRINASALHVKEDVVRATAFSSQPVYEQGERVEIGVILRQRSNNGFVPLGLNEHTKYLITVKRFRGKEVFSYPVNQLSPTGFLSFGFELKDTFLPGQYSIGLSNVQDGARVQIGNFLIADYQAPEFEFEVELANILHAIDPLNINIQANRMNGIALEGASAKVNHRLTHPWQAPTFWPQGYDYSSYDEFKLYEVKSKAPNASNMKLDTKGRLHLKPNIANVKHPFASLNTAIEIVSDDGETQFKDLNTFLMAQPFVIGTKIKWDENSESAELEVIAVDIAGELVSDVKGSLTISEDDKNTDNNSIFSCDFSNLPTTCPLNIKQRRLKIEIDTDYENQKTNWLRSHYVYKEEAEIEDPTFTLELVSEEVTSGDNLTLTVISPRSGMATINIRANGVVKTLSKLIEEGINKLEIATEPKWQPIAKISVVLPLGQDNKALNERKNLASSSSGAKENSDAMEFSIVNISSGLEEQVISSSSTSLPVSPPSPPKKAQRLYTDSITVKIKPPVDAPVIEIDAPESAKAGSDIDISLSSNQNVEVQMWLVNDALFSLIGKSENPLSQLDVVMFPYQEDGQMHFLDAISNHLYDPSLIENSVEMSEKIQVSGARTSYSLFAEDESNRLSVSQPIRHDKGQGESALRALMAQSKWIDSLKLDQDASKTITVKLPNLIGRWRIIAVASNKQLSQATSTTLSTEKPIEYFFDLPSHIFKDDKATAGFTLINKQSVTVKDTLKIMLNDQEIKSVIVKLGPNDYQRKIFSLPSLPIGQHFLRVVDGSGRFVDAAQITVRATYIDQSKRYLIDSQSKSVETLSRFALPEYHMPESLKLYISETGSTGIDWRGMSMSNSRYSHTCWEQTISRSLQYVSNPNASALWEEGGAALKKLLAHSALYQDYSGLFYYFNNEYSYNEGDLHLSAYTYLLSHWLQDSELSLPVNKDALKAALLQKLEEYDVENYSNEAYSMSLWALSVNKDLSLPEVAEYRQRIGVSSNIARTLQLLAIKAAGGETNQQELLTMLDSGYRDTNVGIFNESSQQCMLGMLVDNQSKAFKSLVDELTNKQIKEGDFGSTFANGICAKLFSRHSQKSIDKQAVRYSISDNVASYVSNYENYWLEANFRIPVTSGENISFGADLKQSLLVRKENEWHSVEVGEALEIGDIVKVQYTLRLPTTRQHMAISASIPGAFEAISPDFENQFYRGDYSYEFFDNTHVEIKDGKSKWYPRYLSKGKWQFSYFARVRHSGEYLMPPAFAEAMYRTDVRASSTSAVIKVKANKAP